ncbi:NAD(P)-dependent oxidoreductase [Natrinema marinum]|uniref:NAD(P)-dependent oxidoreductase n=1 Tax=Natrinema marinum TaxID=2961598 RepID=UPI0020C911B7|nr:NAD(P)H-binding protein [Natrinema marinum]
MQLAAFGATGRTGRPLCRQALERGHTVIAHARSPEKLPFADDVTVVEGDVYAGTGVTEAIEGVDAVVSVLGQTAGSPDDLLTVAGDNVLGAMENAGVDRYVTLVGAGDLALGFESIDRADIARFVLDCLEGEEFVRKLPTVGPA